MIGDDDGNTTPLLSAQSSAADDLAGPSHAAAGNPLLRRSIASLLQAPPNACGSRRSSGGSELSVDEVERSIDDLGRMLATPPFGYSARDSQSHSALPASASFHSGVSQPPAESRASTTERPTEVEITVGDLAKFITKDVHRTQSTKALPMYVLFLTVFTLFFILELVEGETSPSFFRDLGSRMQLEAAPLGYLGSEEEGSSMFHEINSYETFFAWLEAGVGKVWPQGSLDQPLSSDPDETWSGRKDEPADPQRANLPLGFVLLRQFRVKGGPCSFGNQLSAIPQSLWAVLEINATLCYPEYSEDALTTEPYTSHDGAVTWTSNVNASRGSFVNSVPRTGVVNSYEKPTKAFTVLLDVRRSFNTDVLMQIRYMRDNGWVDEGTRAVLVEVVTYNQAEASFAFTSCLVEILATNNYVPSTHSSPFHFLTLWHAAAYFYLIADVFCAAYVLYDFAHFIFRLKHDRELEEDGGFFSGVGVWGFFQCAMLGLFLATYYYRARLWLESWGIDENFFEDNRWQIISDFTPDPDRVSAAELILAQERWMWWRLAYYADLFYWWKTLAACCIIFAWLRVFSFVQYYDQWNILTATVQVAAGDLAGVVALGVFVILGYSISAQLLYGDDLRDFRHLRHAIGALLRVMVSGETPDYNDMLLLHRWETRVLILTFYILAWLILLNMILAIITGSFSSVQEAMQGRQSQEQAEGTSLRHFVQQLPLIGPLLFPALNEEGNKKSKGRRSSVSDDSSEEEKDTAKYAEKCVHAVKCLRKAEADGTFQNLGRGEGEGGSFIVKEDFVRYVCRKGNVSLSRPAVDRLFKKASMEVSASNRSVKQGEKWAQGITESLDKVRDLSDAIQHIQESTSKIPMTWKVEKELIDRLESTFSKLTEFDATTGKIKECLELAQLKVKPLPEFSRKMEELRRSMNTVAPTTVSVMKELQRQTQELRPTLLRIEKSLNKWTGKLLEDIKRGTLWGPPTAAAASRALPRLQKQGKGKGVVAKVASYAYPTHYPAEDDDWLASDGEPAAGKTVHWGGEELDGIAQLQRRDPMKAISKTPEKGILKGLGGGVKRTRINAKDL